MTLFVDQAGQPGPATWEVGTYPAGRDDFPIGGISWFEAAAYAEFAGLSLPTVHHWYRAAGVDAGPYILPLANFDREGTLPVGRSGAMSPFGAFDMAGNVREWTWNESGDGRRYTVGGGSGEPPYMFGDPEPRSPFDRSPTTGVRGVKYSAAGAGERSLAPLIRHTRDYRAAKPAPDDAFNHYVRMQQYDPAPLDARVERTTDSPEGWRVERVSFAAAYPNDRVVAYLWIPRHVKPPYQTVLFFPGAESLVKSGSEQLEQPRRLDFLVRSGRAVVHPVYFGMYERFRPRSRGDIERRDTWLRWSQDVRRTLDYLATRPDLDPGRLACFGTSLGASFGAVPLAVDKRFTLALLVGGGFTSSSQQEEVSAVNYVSRVTVPTLLLCGRHDFFFPYETSQKPFFDLLGTPAEHKRHVTVEAGHSVPRHEYFREVLGWLDRYFGPAE
jgi:dienelactone hydrolase